MLEGVLSLNSFERVVLEHSNQPSAAFGIGFALMVADSLQAELAVTAIGHECSVHPRDPALPHVSGLALAGP
jgi:hypothetical protein